MRKPNRRSSGVWNTSFKKRPWATVSEPTQPPDTHAAKRLTEEASSWTQTTAVHDLNGPELVRVKPTIRLVPSDGCSVAAVRVGC
jgi:hypothetical protein